MKVYLDMVGASCNTLPCGVLVNAMKAIEVNGRIDKRHTLRIEEPLTSAPPGRVRVIILVPEDTDIDEEQWLRSAASSTAFDFLRDPEEDVYTVTDGKPLGDEG